MKCPQNLNIDNKSVGIKNDKSRFFCKYCNKSYKYSQGLSKHIKYLEKNKDEDFQELARLLNKNKNMTLIDELKEKNLVIKQITEEETAKANNTVDR